MSEEVPHLIANQLPQLPASLPAHPPGQRGRGNLAGLRHHNVAVLVLVHGLVQDELGHLGGLATPSFSFNNNNLIAGNFVENLQEERTRP